MTIEERLEQAEKLVAEVKAELAAMRATKRNWPERIEAGMCFGREDVRYVLFGKRLANIESGVVWSTSGDPFGGDQSEFDYLGKMDLTIRTDAREPVEGIDEQRQKYANASEYYAAARAPKAHEPTGAELVGRMCMLSKDGISFNACAVVANYNMDRLTYWTKQGHEYKFARLAK